MSTMTETMRTEMRGTLRTWRGPVLAGAAAVTGIGSPLLAHLMPELMASTLGKEAAALIPDPTVGDAWTHWVKNASSLMLIVLVVIAAASVAGERGEGIAQAELAGRGRRGRSLYVVAKALWLLVLTIAATAASACLCLVTTAGVFGAGAAWNDGDGAAHGASAALLWALGALTTLAVTLLVSACSRSTVLPAAVGVVASLLGPTLTMWQAVADRTPLGLSALASAAASGAAEAGAAASAAGSAAQASATFTSLGQALGQAPAVTGMAVPVVLVVCAVAALRRAEL